MRHLVYSFLLFLFKLFVFVCAIWNCVYFRPKRNDLRKNLRTCCMVLYRPFLIVVLVQASCGPTAFFIVLCGQGPYSIIRPSTPIYIYITHFLNVFCFACLIFCSLSPIWNDFRFSTTKIICIDRFYKPVQKENIHKLNYTVQIDTKFFISSASKTTRAGFP